MPYIATTTPGNVRKAEIRHGARLTGIMTDRQLADSFNANLDAYNAAQS
jgi:hypothetical protein